MDEPEQSVLPYTSEVRDASIIERWDGPSRMYRRYESGQLVLERPFTDAENATADRALAEAARRSTQAALLDQARIDLATNQTYLDAVAAGTATSDDAITQVAELTRQALGFIRLTVGGELLDKTT